jgi:LmbE family N-acetylglucosaminyl deacetylase
MTQLRIDAGAWQGAGPVLVVSPHLDDGVMSCGCLIAGLARQRAVAVATVFAGRPRAGDPAFGEWDRAAGFAPGSDVVGRRRTEDRSALAILGARPHWLSFCDSQYGRSPQAGAIARRLARLPALQRNDTVVFFPLGLFHSDHRLVREAVLALLRRRRPGARWLAYEDALYRRLPGLRDAALGRLRRAGLAPRPARAAADAEAQRRKARAVACYRSQLRALATPGRPGHADAFAEERYWQLSAPRKAG